MTLADRYFTMTGALTTAATIVLRGSRATNVGASYGIIEISKYLSRQYWTLAVDVLLASAVRHSSAL